MEGIMDLYGSVINIDTSVITPVITPVDYEVSFLHRGIWKRRARRFPWLWWEQAIYTEKVGDNSVRISYYNPCGDVEDSAETFLTKPCVFYIGPRTNIYIDDNIVRVEDVGLDFGEGIEERGDQIFEFETCDSAAKWKAIVYDAFVSPLKLQCRVCGFDGVLHKDGDKHICSECSWVQVNGSDVKNFEV